MSGIRMFQSGQRVQFPAQGMGTIERASDEGVVVQLDAGPRLHLSREAAGQTLWSLPTEARAAQLRARLLTPAPPRLGTWAERCERYEATLRDGTLEDYVEALREMLAHGAPSSFGERKMLRTLEDNAVAPIAEALGIPREVVTAAVTARSR